jgi:hypothetical protein
MKTSNLIPSHDNIINAYALSNEEHVYILNTLLQNIVTASTIGNTVLMQAVLLTFKRYMLTPFSVVEVGRVSEFLCMYRLFQKNHGR